MIDYYKMIIANGGGIITLKDHLGVFVGPEPENTPPGWLFVDIKELTPEALKEHVDAVRDGRTNWPAKETYSERGGNSGFQPGKTRK